MAEETTVKIPAISTGVQRFLMTGVGVVVMLWQGGDIKTTIAENRIRDEYTKEERQEIKRRLESVEWQMQEIWKMNAAIMAGLGIKYEPSPRPNERGYR